MSLSEKCTHPRDALIIFEENGHVYTYNNTMHPISVTTVIHNFFPKFDADSIILKMQKSKNWINSKYYGMTKEQIKNKWSSDGKEASHLGTLMHASIENYFNFVYPNEYIPKESDSKEFLHFLGFWKAFSAKNPEWKPHKCEWIVYDEDKCIAGRIDFILKNDKDQYVILDWKRSKEIKKNNIWQKGFDIFNHLDDCNYNHYTLQLNIYRHILETKYNKQVVAMYLVICHPDNSCAEVIPVNKKVDDILNLWNCLPLKNHH